MKSRIVELGRQLGLSIDQINSIMNDTSHNSESVSLSLGPPLYPGAHYGTISINDFNDERNMRKRNVSEIMKFARQVGVTTDQIHSILDSALPDIEPVSLSLGPPHYPGAFYGTVSMNHFYILKR